MLITAIPNPGVVSVGGALRQYWYNHFSKAEVAKGRGAPGSVFAPLAALAYQCKVQATAGSTGNAAFNLPFGAQFGELLGLAQRVLGEVHMYNDEVGNTSNAKCQDVVTFFEFFRASAISQGSLPAPLATAQAATQAVSTTKDHDVAGNGNRNGGSLLTLVAITAQSGTGTWSVVDGKARYVATATAGTATATCTVRNAEGQTVTGVVLTVTLS